MDAFHGEDGGEAHLKWLRLFRAQTAPATILLVLTPYLHGGGSPLNALLLGAYALLVHWLSFGMNSLHDYLGGWDKADPSKAHHPLSTGEIKVEDALRVVHWCVPTLLTVGVVATVAVSPNPVWALACLILFYAWGISYNLGLSKVSLLGFIPITVCFTAMAGWAWLLSHPSMDMYGWVWLSYVWFTIMFQISWSGHLKEMGVAEKGNLLIEMGARLNAGEFKPGASRFYGWTVKLFNLFIGCLLLSSKLNLWRLVWFWFFAGITVYFLHQLTKPRMYDRPRELMRMSVMEVATIYLALAILEPPEVCFLAVFGVAYFYLVNRILWGVAYPRV